MDQLVEQGRDVAEPSSRARIYREVQRLVAHDLPYLTLWYEDNVAVAQRDITAIRLDPKASFNFLTRVRSGKP